MRERVEFRLLPLHRSRASPIAGEFIRVQECFLPKEPRLAAFVHVFWEYATLEGRVASLAGARQWLGAGGSSAVLFSRIVRSSPITGVLTQ